MENIKIVAVGDGAVGKTSMLISFVENTFASDYLPTIFDNYAKTIVVDDKMVALQLWDTAGQEDYDRIRPLSYPLTQVFLICFAITATSSLENVKSKWIPEIRHHMPPDAILFLVGTKGDSRKITSMYCIDDIYAERVAKETGVCRYMECSALTQEGVQELFLEVVREVRKRRVKPSPPSCCLLS